MIPPQKQGGSSPDPWGWDLGEARPRAFVVERPSTHWRGTEISREWEQVGENNPTSDLLLFPEKLEWVGRDKAFK